MRACDGVRARPASRASNYSTGTVCRTPSPRTGEPLTFRLHYEAHVPVEDPIFGIGVTHLEGALVTGTNTARHHHHIDKITGDGWIDFVIPSLPLLEGTFEITVAITDHTELHQIDRWQHALRFDVRRGDIVEEGLATLAGTWEFGALDEGRGMPR